MTSVAEVSWVRIPGAVRRFWPTLGLALGDGAYLRAWPVVAVAAPPFALLVGLVFGATHPLAVAPGTIYTYSLFLVAVLAVIGCVSAALGFWAWLGFVVTDFLFTDRSTLPGFGYSVYNASPLTHLTHGYVPLLMSYLLLAGLVVVVPLIASGFSRRTVLALRSRRELALPAGQAVRVATMTLFTYGWAQATPFMIRPLWSFSGAVPDTQAVQPIQSNIGLLTGIVIVAAIGRATLMLLASGRKTPEAALPAAATEPHPISAVLRLAAVPLQALFTTLLLAGLVDQVWQGIIVWLLLNLILYARLLLIPRIPVYPALIRRVPMLLRILACVLVSYVMTSVVVEPAVQRGERSFLSLVVVVFGSLVVAAFLLPAQPPPARAPGASGAVAGPPLPGPPAPSSFVPGRASLPQPPVPPAPPAGSAMRYAATFPATDAGPGIGVLRRGLGMICASLLAVVGVLALDASPALADNCSALSDCSFGVKVALVVAGIALVLLAWWLLPEILGGAAILEEEAAILAAEEAAAAEAAAAEAAAAEAEAAAAAEAEAAAAEAEGAAEAAGEAEAEAASEAEAEAEAERLRQLGEDPATGQFRQSEMETAGRIEDELGIKLERSTNPNVDWVDANGKTYDAVGNFDSKYFDQQWPNLQEKIVDHLAKADAVPIDVSKFTPSQIAQIEQFIQNLGPHVFLVGN